MVEGKVEIRRVELSDIHLMVKFANNPLVLVNMRDNFPDPFLVEDAVDFVNREMEEVIPKYFVILFNGDFAGMIGLLSQSLSYRHSAELGFWIAEPYWNFKIAERAVKLMVNHTFASNNYERLFCKVFQYNRPSMRVLEKAGFKLEGIGKMAIQKNNKIFDEHLYAILKQTNPSE